MSLRDVFDVGGEKGAAGVLSGRGEYEGLGSSAKTRIDVVRIGSINMELLSVGIAKSIWLF